MKVFPGGSPKSRAGWGHGECERAGCGEADRSHVREPQILTLEAEE